MSQKFWGIRCFSAGRRPFTNHAFIGQNRPVLQLFHRFLCKTVVFVDKVPRTFSLFEDFFKQGFRFGEILRNPPTFCLWDRVRARGDSLRAAVRRCPEFSRRPQPPL